MSDGNEGRATELAALRLAVAVAENYARNGSAESLHRTLCEALSAARESALREAWVPCAERMPDGEARNVLVLIEDGERVYQDVWHWSPQLGEHSSFRKYVTHWMPLPAPPPLPKGTSDGEK